MSVRGYTDWQARRGQQPADVSQVPAVDDPLAQSIRMALDARALGLTPARTLVLMESCGFGIDVEELTLPGASR